MLARKLMAMAVLAMTAIVSSEANAQASMGIGHADYCRINGTGLVLGVKTWIDLKSPRSATMDHLGLRQGGPRRKLADLAYTRLEAGASVAAVEEEVHRLCLTIPQSDMEDDEPTFNEVKDGAGAQVCADVASSVAGFLLNEPGLLNAPVLEVLQAIVPENSDRPLPELGRTVEIGQRLARVNRDETKLIDSLMKHCSGLTSEARARLDSEFYVE